MKSKLLTIGQKNLARDVIFRDATKIALQQVRKWTSTTASSKLAAFGGDTEKLGFMLYETIDSPYSQKSIAGMAQRLYDEWSRASLKIFSGKSKDHISQAVSIARGSREKATKDTKGKVVDNIFIIIFSCLGFMILLSVYMLITLWSDLTSIPMESLFHIKCHKILDHHKVEVVVETVDSILISMASVVFIELKELKILMFVISGEKGISKDNAIL